MTAKKTKNRFRVFVLLAAAAALAVALWLLCRVDSAEHFAFREMGEISEIYVVREDLSTVEWVDGKDLHQQQFYLLEGEQRDTLLSFLRTSSYRKRVHDSLASYLVGSPGSFRTSTHDSFGYRIVLKNTEGDLQHLLTMGDDYICVTAEYTGGIYLKILTKDWGPALDDILHSGQLLDTYLADGWAPFPEGWEF